MPLLTRAIFLSTLVIPLQAFSQTAPVLSPYTACKFDDGLTATDYAPLPPDVAGRTVDTIAGPRQVPLLRGERITFGYPTTDPFAETKIEQLPPESFAQGKTDLIANFDHILSNGDDGTRNMTYALHPILNGFEIHGLDRVALDGKVLGIYLLIDNGTHVVTTVNFLNQGPLLRKFSTLEEYTGLRDHFLNAYTTCIHTPQVVAVAVKAKPAAKMPVSRHTSKSTRKAARPRHKTKPRPHSRSTNTSAN